MLWYADFPLRTARFVVLYFCLTCERNYKMYRLPRLLALSLVLGVVGIVVGVLGLRARRTALQPTGQAQRAG
jgi:hypothetical protein